MKIDLFNEFYSCYFCTVYHILKETANRELTDAEFRELVKKTSDYYGFPETTNLIVGKSIDIGKNIEVEGNKDAWPFFDRIRKKGSGRFNSKSKNSLYINKNRLSNISDFPLSTIEKMWLKSLFTDSRIKLFLKDRVNLPDLDIDEPFFDWDDFVLFDQYSDGDSFNDEHYIEMFQEVLQGVNKQVRLEIKYKKPNNNISFKPDGSFELASDHEIGTVCVDPDYIEYSERDNKFRLIGENPKYGRVIVNISSILGCKAVERQDTTCRDSKWNCSNDSLKREAIFELIDNNNVLERFLMSFSHYEKEAEFLKKDKRYRVKITYDETDETDLVIRVLSFGPHVRTIGPEYFIELIRERLRQQRSIAKEIKLDSGME